ncbi:MAG: glutamine-hydrolyzing carbamoyl-phosphate synthase small subunit [Kiritimatiellae bacterium]|nr:glutamine-hydrolyzing carbamoyl-phosphate synthase small subunit [Kiritimatiellia bacterium]
MRSKKWNWTAQRAKEAFIALEDGALFRGYSVGARKDALGEIVFNTGMTGYQEIMSDPSYAGQLVVMTFPEIGNTGVNADDMESKRFFANGFIMHNLNESSSWRAEKSLAEAFCRADIPSLAGIATRALTTKLRTHGTMKAYLSVSGILDERAAVEKARAWSGLDGQDYARRVSCKKKYRWDENDELSRSWGTGGRLPAADLKIVAYDFGIKWNILRRMRAQGGEITVVPAATPARDVLALKPDGVILSNGPADPAALTYAIKAARELLGKIPLMGICLGHQILGLALGGKTCRLKFGHHGCNHPVKELSTGRVEITSQNHNFAVQADSLDKNLVEITHLNLNDNTIEGFRHKKFPMLALQYHPEAAPGPHDASCFFNNFRSLIERSHG